MAVADSFDEKRSFLKSFATLAEASLIAAQTYAKQAERPTIVINIDHGSVRSGSDVTDYVLDALRKRDR